MSNVWSNYYCKTHTTHKHTTYVQSTLIHTYLTHTTEHTNTHTHAHASSNIHNTHTHTGGVGRLIKWYGLSARACNLRSSNPLCALLGFHNRPFLRWTFISPSTCFMHVRRNMPTLATASYYELWNKENEMYYAFEIGE